VTKAVFSRRSLAFAGISGTALLLLNPLIVQASIGSLLGGLLELKANAAGLESPSAHNSQTVPLLRAAINIDPTPLKGGGDITIVGGRALLAEAGPSGTLADLPDAPVSDQISIYVVRKGDTLGGIARMFGVSVNTIVWANDVKRGFIAEGQTLIILPISGVQHIVAKGETIQSIAKKYKGSVEEILQFNDLLPGASLAVGDVIIIPDGEIAAPPASSGSKPTSAVYGTSGPSYVGYYLRPVLGPKTQGLHGYNGIDLGSSYGTTIKAAASGQIIIARDFGWNGGYGTYVVIAHSNGTQTLYSHMADIFVSGGQYVTQGQSIGTVGATGKTTGPHLHFEVRGAKNPF